MSSKKDRSRGQVNAMLDDNLPKLYLTNLINKNQYLSSNTTTGGLNEINKVCRHCFYDICKLLRITPNDRAWSLIFLGQK